ncbi:hypothetical protein GGU10DRAFT_409719 [Lentinula aff. detonsa]|uniref:Uncharacterized protein n=1 Tax=Lentinula aff. detonsa TaxID=2804958 RepID=A0AA38NNX6_9AGAR|nr:hypothetical protein GGU10DRAFT_409719 [Lentinula aff. detonsa]
MSLYVSHSRWYSEVLTLSVVTNLLHKSYSAGQKNLLIPGIPIPNGAKFSASATLTPDNVIETISPKTTQRLTETEVSNDCYRALEARVNLSSFNQAQPSLFESFSSVEKLQDVIGDSINIEDDESCIRAILKLMVTKDIVSRYDDQKSLEDNMKPVFLRPNHNLRPLRFGVYDWQKSIWARPRAESEPNFLCFACYKACLGFDNKQSKVVEILPKWRSIPGEKGHIDTDLHSPLMYKFDHRKGATWSDPDQKDRTLVQFLQDTGDLNKAAGGDIKDPESYIRAVLRYLSPDSVGLIQGYDPTKSLSHLIEYKREKSGDGQDVGDKEPKRIKGRDSQDVGNGGYRTEDDNADTEVDDAGTKVHKIEETGRLAHGDGQVVRGGQEVGDGRDSRDRTANNAGTEGNNADIVHSASKIASIHNLIN